MEGAGGLLMHDLKYETKARNELGYFAPSMTKQWTKSAVECWQKCFKCEDCPVYWQMTSQPCQMKAAVIELVKNVGLPNENNCRSWSFYGYQIRKRINT